MIQPNLPYPTSVICSDDQVYCLDYEGFIGRRPSLAGLLLHGQFRQYTFEAVLEPLANDLNVEYVSWPDWVAYLMQLRAKGYLAVGYSMHEAEVSPELGPAEEWYRNAHRFLKRHVIWPEGRRPRKWDLPSLATHCGMTTVNYGTKQATQRLRYALQFAAKYGTAKKFTPTAKAKWTKLLNYNHQDVFMLEHVTEYGRRLPLRQACQ